MDYDIKDISLAEPGKNKIEWAGENMPVVRGIKKDFITSKPLKGLTAAACLHVTSETANLMIALKSGGADVFCVLQIRSVPRMMLLLLL